ncbi:TVP38/TMEM64 family protein [Candidatus Viadribacter manganicus]|uniref:TVP38/TMEM64 family protein n=1 Tax=Candidatus Viadribacter manganicus TaxID=1759059 RepID=UPI0009F5E1A3|nr:VTT domain-containing protein [Candidatus Viadribacter manganicus]
MSQDAAQQEPPIEDPSEAGGLRDFVSSMDARAWRAVILSVLSVVLVLVLLVAGRFLFGDQIERFIDETLGQANRGHWGLLATVLVFTLTAYVGAPQVALIAACVVAFGAEVGFWYAWIATVISGVATYFTGRLTSAQTQKRFGGATGGRFTRFMGKNTLLASFVVRFIPTGPFIVANMAFGAMRANFWAYIVGLAVGVLPKTMMVAFFGNSVLNAFQGEFLAAAVMAALAIVVAIAIALIVRRFARRDAKEDKSDE